MRLQELIDFAPRSTTKGVGSRINRAHITPGNSTIGNGILGTAFDTSSNKRLNQVTKVGRAGSLDDNSETMEVKDISDDGYLSYLKMVYDYELAGNSNPYFPRIHDLKVYKDPAGKIHYSVNLEKLLPFNSPKIMQNDDLMISLCGRMFGRSRGNNFDDFIVMQLQVAEGNMDRVIKDEHLKEALGMIFDLVNSNTRFWYDMHHGNIMWRMTGTMPQLVILDPIV